MAVDVWSEISSLGVISPRISFSHDLTQSTEPDADASTAHRQRSDCCLLESDFNFFIGGGGNFRGEFSSADELFSNGRILPVEIKKQPHRQQQNATGKKAVPIPPPPAERSGENDFSPQLDSERKKLLKEFLSVSLDGDHEEQSHKRPPSAAAAEGSRSFWQFKRSNSLNCDESSCRSRGGLIRSLHFLSRSNSTGSAPNPPKTKPPKDETHRHLRKQRSVPNRKSPLMPTSAAPFYYPYNPGGPQQHQKLNLPALRKCGSYGNNSAGIRISPVLNIPPPAFISRGTVNFLGLGSLFCNGKINNKKKKKKR